MKKKKYLPLYYEWMKTGRMPWRGLCGSLESSEEMETIFGEEYLGGYWVIHDFTPLRQNIVLLLAAMNDEL